MSCFVKNGRRLKIIVCLRTGQIIDVESSYIKKLCYNLFSLPGCRDLDAQVSVVYLLAEPEDFTHVSGFILLLHGREPHMVLIPDITPAKYCSS